MVGNFAPGLVETGFMEAFMDWFLIYRTEDEVRALASKVDAATASWDVVTDDSGQVVYLVLTKAAVAAASETEDRPRAGAPQTWRPRQTTQRGRIAPPARVAARVAQRGA